MKDKLTTDQLNMFKEVGAQIRVKFDDIKQNKKKIFLKFEKWPSLEMLRTKFDSSKIAKTDNDVTTTSTG